MLYSQIVSVLALASSAFAAPNADISKRAQTVYLAGDSTMARASGVTTGSFQVSPPHHHQSNSLTRLGRLPPLLALPYRRQQSHRWPQLPLLHARRPLRRDHQPRATQRHRRHRIRAQRRRLAFIQRQRPFSLRRRRFRNMPNDIQRCQGDRPHIPVVPDRSRQEDHRKRRKGHYEQPNTQQSLGKRQLSVW